ncbi:uncharacterized protein LOC131161719 [Malania oleifera]|uniref:uncharacterized protein LOC131161719 n=1 Tax=Malania oleifera TaxID=397392 RepID=UPI0025AE982D|nr:uncharacterized protein LOC131161719 [Malania oleifera]
MAAIGWYGPLIDLSSAASHIGDYVQLLDFVHRSTPVQYKLSKGGASIRTDIQVCDDTRPFFSISLWQKQMGSMVFAGDVILLQNARITKFHDVVEARTVHCSSLLCLVHPYESLMTKGVDDLLKDCRVGATTREKLKKVIEWAQRAGSIPNTVELDSYQKRQWKRNWKDHEERKSQDCFSLSGLSNLTNSCKATFYGSIGEIFLPITWRILAEYEEEKMFISRRLYEIGDDSLAEDIICTGCQLCGSPLDLDSGSTSKPNSVPFYCHSSSNRLHKISLIYRPFMLYVWDEMGYIPLLVRNKAAEVLFATIGAEKVRSCYLRPKLCCPKDVHTNKHSHARTITLTKAATDAGPCSTNEAKSQCREDLNFYLIWLSVLRILLQGKNSPLKFEVNVNADLDRENGRFEMVSVSMPCFKII